MSANLENSAVATDWKWSTFIPIPKKGSVKNMQKIFKLPYNCTHFTCQQCNAQNPSSQVSAVHELKFQMYEVDLEKAEEPEIKLPTSVTAQKKQGNSRKRICFIDYAKAFVYVDHNKMWKILKETEIPDHLTCLLRNLYKD